jgi:hypothetical protein
VTTAKSSRNSVVIRLNRCSIAASLLAEERTAMFNDERNSTSDTSSTNSSYHASIDPMRPRAEHPSSHRLPRLAAAPGGQDLWASMLASIRQLSSPPNPMRNTPDLSRRPRSGGMPSRSSKRAGGKVRTYTVTIVEELSTLLPALARPDTLQLPGAGLVAVCCSRARALRSVWQAHQPRLRSIFPEAADQRGHSTATP